MFSRNLAKVEGKGRDGRPLAETETRMVTRRGEDKEGVEEEATNTGSSFFSRSTARASLKKSRPHSWHSTLQVDIDHGALLSSESQIYLMFQRDPHHHHDLNASARTSTSSESEQREREGKVEEGVVRLAR